MNTLALRCDLSGNPTFGELLQRIRKTALDAYAHQDLPFEKLVAELQPARNLSYSPVFQVMFILQNTRTPATQADSLRFAQQDIDAGSSKLDLTLNLQETADGCAGWVEYSTDIFDRSTIERLLDQFQFLLRSVVENPSTPLSELASERVADGANRQIGTNGSDEDNSEQLQRSSIEKKLASIWSEVLGVQQIDPTDNLFDLGGHSLLITRIISRIRSIFQVDVPIHAFFEAPTVSAIAAVVESQIETGRTKGVAMNQVIRKRGSLHHV